MCLKLEKETAAFTVVRRFSASLEVGVDAQVSGLPGSWGPGATDCHQIRGGRRSCASAAVRAGPATAEDDLPPIINMDGFEAFTAHGAAIASRPVFCFLQCQVAAIVALNPL